MNIENSVAFVTGANRGLGRHFASQLLERGATRVYAAARNPERVDLPGVVPVRFDLTDPESIVQAAALASDTTLLVNNAGISTHTRLTDGDFDQIRLELQTHFFGTLATTRALAPAIAANGGGAILNVLSVLSWRHLPDYGAYSAAKAAAWAMTNVIRQELAPSGISVTALHVGYMDTDMASYVAPENKTDPAAVAAAALDGIEAGDTEVIGDELTRNVKRGLAEATALV
ncbi:SDR family oxidoreductase [Candidatus Solirubrobacter pratensis]|uniref:SDR family oxidoreductase n=1 Tax=Candidatus Solirubrobacter pratensis TaxID=1298857 RepID=UPI0004024D45|nr:SDR family oxidoreductase [Candidatus Solirubrobacter pratensis]